MELYDLIDEQEREGIKNYEITNIAFDCNEVRSGGLFVALVGKSFDGHDFVNEAQKNGALVAVVERNVEVDIPQIKVKNTRQSLALISKRFFENAVDKVPVIAITGTNGKTTTSYMLATILHEVGCNPCIIGTNGVQFNDRNTKIDLTTPDPPAFHEIVKSAVDGGATHIITEASAHALALDKLYGINVQSGAFTNFSQDHLDYFDDMSDYFKAKAKLVCMSKSFVLNYDDEKVMALYDDRKITFGFSEKADIYAKNLALNELGSTFDVVYKDETKHVYCSLVGKFNVYNSLCAIALACCVGIDFALACSAISKVKRVDGRVNSYQTEKGVVLIDFAHTPDGLQNLLVNARMLCKNKLVLVFGCGGNRDKEKRYIMGRIASKYCDRIIVTNDNPRDEEPYSIISEIVRGIKDNKMDEYYITPDRKSAIIQAYESMDASDIMVIAGKGAEKYQEIRGVKYPYSDEMIVKTLLKD